MMIAKNEEERLKALRRFEILDTPPDGNFDRITALVSKMFKMPIALITLVDHDRIWFKSGFGLSGVEQIDRDPGLCASAILSDEIYIIENALDDPRTLDNPLVRGEFGLRFYAAAQLKTYDGFNIGNLCVIDRSQRYLNSDQKEMLQEFAAIVVDEMEIRLSARKMVQEYRQQITQLQQELAQLKAKRLS